jgi:hypothetical protein
MGLSIDDVMKMMVVKQREQWEDPYQYYDYYEKGQKIDDWSKLFAPSAIKITQEDSAQEIDNKIIKEILEDHKKPKKQEIPKRRKFDLSI